MLPAEGNCYHLNKPALGGSLQSRRHQVQIIVTALRVDAYLRSTWRQQFVIHIGANTTAELNVFFWDASCIVG